MTGHQSWLQANVLLPLATLLLILPVTLLFDRFLIFVDLAQEQPTTLAWFLFLPYWLVAGLILYLTLRSQFKLDSTHRRQFWPLLPPIWALLINLLLFSFLPYPTDWSLSHLLMVLLDGFASLWLLIAILRFGLLTYLPYYSSLTFQRMPTAGLVLDNQQRILALNPPAEQLFQISLDQVEGQTLDQALPMLHHPTEPLMLNHLPYSCSYTQLFDRGDQLSGQIVRIHLLPTPESEQQLLDDLGLAVRELKYDSPDGHSYSWNEYLGDLIFQVTMVGSLSVTHVEAEIEIVDRKLQAVAQRYPHRQLHAIIDIEQGFNLDRQAREIAINQWIKWGQDPNFGHMAVIQGRGIIKVVLNTLQRLAPALKISIHPNLEEALAYLRQQQRQAVDKSQFLQLWHVEQETMSLGDLTLKVVRRPQWSYQSDTAQSQFYLIEGKTLVCSVSGRLEAEDVTRQIELSEELKEENGHPFTFVISDLSQVTWIDRKGRSLAQKYVKGAPYYPDHHLMIFPPSVSYTHLTLPPILLV